ncbi:dATP/dGTP pyrophosphohydrolase domain-containing protein [Hoeflea alexandrii]|uniref:DUF550 domain-containing protein n=1 Tax=Hoeflea alexandrii TaxID=288436 RepID=A0ABT1CV71_9HYPH|nr:dATP/dGTP pyrophosphohydrolase domain-containing protein [Hoeflea alexandrii]MCO6410068.1 DUF550 domain-containing protein [Hoeflea alexandrii]MCY0153040.1 DUF550 domain-containing protein [Hoeflea alexandrii]
MTLDLKQHLLRQMAFSHATFGHGTRTEGVVDHIRKELEEVAASGGSAREWVDVVILGLDGLTRELAFGATSHGGIAAAGRRDPEAVARMACHLVLEKQARNEGRTWPDWRTVDAGKAIEHDRTGEGQ